MKCRQTQSSSPPHFNLINFNYIFTKNDRSSGSSKRTKALKHENQAYTHTKRTAPSIPSKFYIPFYLLTPTQSFHLQLLPSAKVIPTRSYKKVPTSNRMNHIPLIHNEQSASSTERRERRNAIRADFGVRESTSYSYSVDSCAPPVVVGIRLSRSA